MRKIVFFVAILLKGSLAFINRDCNLRSCRHILPDFTSYNDLFLLNAERLQESCPNILRYIQCAEEEIQRCENSTLAELSTRDDRDIAAYGGLLYGTSGLAKDLCDENTDIHKGFVASIDCINRTVLQRPNYRCMREADYEYLAYAGKSNTRDKYQCMVGIYAFACVSEYVQKRCGEEARLTIVELLKRSKAVHYHLCTKEDFLELQTKFRDHLELEEDRRRIFDEAFDL